MDVTDLGLSLQYGELVALGHIQLLAGLQQQARQTFELAEAFRHHIVGLLWDPGLQFFSGLKVSPPTRLDLEGDAPANSRWALPARELGTRLVDQYIYIYIYTYI